MPVMRSPLCTNRDNPGTVRKMQPRQKQIYKVRQTKKCATLGNAKLYSKRSPSIIRFPQVKLRHRAFVLVFQSTGKDAPCGYLVQNCIAKLQ